ncbi:hypothetical protein [Gorillibacterium sp. sgz5001074]|uniref:hypothetical protein n=1 Tax=Gorillibacterium sp. sgz5001074 TaxID=3446695 RepID=UPI003F6642C2
MGENLLLELTDFVRELESKEASTVYTVPPEVLQAVKKARSLEKLLHEIFVQASGSGGIHLHSVLRREFGIRSELMDKFGQWVPFSKDQFEEELHDAIDRAEIRAGNQGVFFAGTPGRAEAAEALELLKGIAHSAVTAQFRRRTGDAAPYVDILERTLRFYGLPNTYPEGNEAQYRTLISEERLRALAGGEETITEALKETARAWYRQSGFTFLETRQGTFSHEEVPHLLYALTADGRRKLQQDYIRHIEEEYRQVRRKPDLHRAHLLLEMLKDVLRWPVTED